MRLRNLCTLVLAQDCWLTEKTTDSGLEEIKISYISESKMQRKGNKLHENE
jgi:hypothetical protein